MRPEHPPIEVESDKPQVRKEHHHALSIEHGCARGERGILCSLIHGIGDLDAARGEPAPPEEGPAVGVVGYDDGAPAIHTRENDLTRGHHGRGEARRDRRPPGLVDPCIEVPWQGHPGCTPCSPGPTERRPVLPHGSEDEEAEDAEPHGDDSRDPALSVAWRSISKPGRLDSGPGGCGGTGRRIGLKIRRASARPGSTPGIPTKRPPRIWRGGPLAQRYTNHSWVRRFSSPSVTTVSPSRHTTESP